LLIRVFEFRPSINFRF